MIRSLLTAVLLAAVLDGIAGVVALVRHQPVIWVIATVLIVWLLVKAMRAIVRQAMFEARMRWWWFT